MTDEELSGEGAAAPAPERAEPTTPRDEAGRFASQRAAENDDGQSEQPGSPPAGMVPHQALHAAKAERDAARKENDEIRRRLEEQDRTLAEVRGFMQGSKRAPEKAAEPEKPISFWDNPEEFVRRQITELQKPLSEKATEIEGTVSQQRLNASELAAVQEHGRDTVAAALEAARQAKAADARAFKFEYDRIMAAPHPFAALVAWHKNQSVLSRFGADPDAAFEAEVERRLQARLAAADNGGAPGEEPAPAQQQAAAKPKAPMPTNFAGGARSASTRAAGSSGTPKSLSEIMGR